MTDDQTKQATLEQTEAERSDDEELSSEELENVAGGGRRGPNGSMYDEANGYNVNPPD